MNKDNFNYQTDHVLACNFCKFEAVLTAHKESMSPEAYKAFVKFIQEFYLGVSHLLDEEVNRKFIGQMLEDL